MRGSIDRMNGAGSYRIETPQHEGDGPLYPLRARAQVLRQSRTSQRHPSHDVIGQTKRVTLAMIEQHQPDIVAIEEPLNVPTERAHLLNVISDEVRERALELGMELVEMSPIDIRQRLTRNPRTTKFDMAEHRARNGFEKMADLTPKRPSRAALVLRPKDKYGLHVFDALALAVTCRPL